MAQPSLLEHEFANYVAKRNRVRRRFARILYFVSFVSLLASVVLVLETPKTAQDYTQQVEQLKQVQVSLDNVQKFVAAQKESLVQTQETINKLREDERQIKPLLETDRQTVEAVLRAYRHEQLRSVWTERFFGFTAGIISSLCASLLYAVILGRHNKEAGSKRADESSSKP